MARNRCRMAASKGLTPTMFSTRVRLQLSTFSAISVATLGNRFIGKCVAPIRIFSVAIRQLDRPLSFTPFRSS